MLFILVLIAIAPSGISQPAAQQKLSRPGMAISKPSTMKFQWKMSDRFVYPFNYSGSRFVLGYDRLGHQYQPSYVNPDGWNVELKINEKPSIGRPLFKYNWKISGMKDQQGNPISYELNITSTKDGLLAIGSRNHGRVVYQPSALAKMNKMKMPSSIGLPSVSHPIPSAFSFDTIPQFPALGIYSITISKKYNNSTDTTTLETQHVVITLKDYLVVVVGDSFNSGEGNPDVAGLSDDECWCRHETITHIVNDVTHTDLDMVKPAAWLEEGGHRSFKSGAVQAAAALENYDPHSSVTLVTVATSGAKIDAGLLFPQHCEWQTLGQIDEVKKYVGTRTIDFLLISIGLNDLGGKKGGVGDILIAAADPLPPEFDGTDEYKGLSEALRVLPEKFELVRDKLKILKIKSVILIQPPLNIFRDKQNRVRSTDDGLLAFLEWQDVAKIDMYAFKVGDCQRAAANRFGWTYLDGVVDSFLGHGYFEEYTSDSWFVQAEESCIIQGDWSGMIHPNGRGHAKIKDLLFDKIKQITAVPQAQENGAFSK